jgi:hypothetical protein
VWTDSEKWWNRRHQMRAFVDYAYATSMEIMGWNARVDDTEQNALQHAIWNASMARAWGLADAKAWADAHEDLGRALTAVEVLKKNMDLANNHVGRSSANSSGYVSGSAKEDVLGYRGQLCWLLGAGAAPSGCAVPSNH